MFRPAGVARPGLNRYRRLAQAIPMRADPWRMCTTTNKAVSRAATLPAASQTTRRFAPSMLAKKDIMY